MSKVLKIILICVLSAVVIALTTFMVLLMTGKIKLSGFKFNVATSTKLVYDKEYDVSFNKININTKSADIEIKNSSDDKIKLTIYDDKDKTNVVEENGILNIKVDNDKCKFLCFNLKIAKIVLYLPTDYNGKVNIDGDYGDITVGTFAQAKLDISNDTGDIRISSISNVVIDTDCGDVRISKINNYFNIKTDVGDVRLDNINLNKDSSIKTDVGDVRIGKTNEVYFDTKSDVGDVKINNNYRKSDITVKIKTDVGDIRVNN